MVLGGRSPKVSAWLNVNAFVARLTVQGVRNFATYGNWALRDALEEEIEVYDGAHCPAPSKAYKAELLFKVAAVWICLAGLYMFDRLIPDPEDGKEPDALFWTHPQWDKWRGSFEEEAQKEQYSNEVTIVAKECAAVMATFPATRTID